MNPTLDPHWPVALADVQPAIFAREKSAAEASLGIRRAGLGRAPTGHQVHSRHPCRCGGRVGAAPSGLRNPRKGRVRFGQSRRDFWSVKK